MVVTDPIADMFTSLRNAAAAGRQEAVVPYAKFSEEIARLLQNLGYLEEVRKFKEQGRERFLLSLKGPKFSHLKRLSKPGSRWYVPWRKLEHPSAGVRIVSTPRGVMTHAEARKRKLGGELVGEVW